MKLRYKFTLYVFIAGLFCVTILTVFYSMESRKTFLTVARDNSFGIADHTAQTLDMLLREKARNAHTLTHNDGFIRALTESNQRFSGLSEDMRTMEINSLNDRWVSIDDPDDVFIRSYTHNILATFLRHHVAEMGNEYGEIFLTNRYGALVASTSKLTTLKHAHKYWWQAAYNDGDGRTFFDDRGYDTSVGDYVLGVVVPVEHNGEVIGILKSNINIIGSIGEIIGEFGDHYEGTLDLVRSSGLIVYHEGAEPLSSELSPALIATIQLNIDTNDRFPYDEPDSIITFSTVHISEGSQDYGFGGNQESIDHIGGNVGEKWLIMARYDMGVALRTVRSTWFSLFTNGMITVLILAAVAYLFGNRMSKPIIRIAEHTASVRAGSLDIRYNGQSNDEIGLLGESVNAMTEDLHRYSIKMEELVSQRTRELEKALQEIKSLQGIIPICSYCKQIRNDEGAWEQLESYFLAHTDALFSHGICPECYKRQMDEVDE